MSKLVKRLCYKFSLKTISPLSIGGSYTEETDHDIISYADNTPFIPASTIAGCFFTKDEAYHNAFGIVSLGNSKNKDLAQSSPLFVSDGLFTEGDIKLGTRDGNALENDGELYKQAKDTAKFNSQIIMNNQAWSFYVTITITDRSKNDEAYYDEAIRVIAGRIKNGIYRLGYKQNRGYGQQKLIKVVKKSFEKDNYYEYLNFDGYSFVGENIDINDVNDDSISLIMPVRAISPICIRDYAAIKHVPDYAQIRGLDENGKDSLAAIPGTSLNGVIQGAAIRIANEMHLGGLTKLEEFKSYVIDEMYLKGSFLTQSRNRLDRFSGATIDGALYTEQIFTPTKDSTGEIKIRFKHNNLKLIALFYLALCEIKEGYASVGGNEGIGRGIFELNGEIEIKGTSLNQLAEALREEL